MVRKRKKQEEEKPWCFYCDREFNDETDLILHQKNKHFKCGVCNKRLTTAKALTVHSLQVHKVAVHEIPDAKKGREDPKWEIFGSSGIPAGMQRGEDPPKPGTAPAAPSGAMPPGMPPPYGAPPPYARPPYGAPPPYYGAGMPPPYGMPPPPYGAGPMPPYPRPGAGPGFPPYPPRPGHGFPPRPPPHMMPGMAPPPGMPGPMPPRPGFPAPITAPPYQAPTGQVPGSVPPQGQLPAGAGGVAPPTVSAPQATQQQPVVSSGPVVEQPAVPTVPVPEGGGGPELVWADEEVSMEERRASLAKYSSPPPMAV